MTKRTDAIGNITTFGPYDHLGRPGGVSYGLAGATAATPPVTYSYDAGFHGALTSVSSSASSTTYTYDGFGRIATSTQTTNGTPYSFHYNYSLTDQLTCIRYPSGRQVGSSLDVADRIQGVQNMVTGTAQPCQSVQNNYASSISYTPAGGINSMTMGNGVVHQPSWNDRLQVTGLTATKSGSALLGLSLYPCPGLQTACSSGNNGNLQSQTIAMPGLSLTQGYSYDSLNRLQGVTENSTTLESYGYDASGNRAVTAHSSGLPILTAETPQSLSWYTTGTPPTGCPTPSANQVKTWCYDVAGNVTGIPATGGTTTRASCWPANVATGVAMLRTGCYDAENRMISETDMNGTTSSYVYDGSGLRVSKTAIGGTTVYVYDAFGNLAAEYGSPDPNPCSTTATCYVTWDHLGSTRMLTDNNGAAQKCYDYLPFGGEIPLGVNGRGNCYSSTPDRANPKFTGQMRDSESALDWFNVRHMSGTQGRFQSVDPANAGASLGDPQTWNAYSYVANNPLSYTDPSGECWWCTLLGVGLDIAGFFTGGTTTILGSILTTAGTVATGGSIGGGIIGGISGGVNSGPWNEQIPLGGPGALQGAINSGLVIENFENSSGGVWYENLPTFPTWFVDVVAGAGDALTFRLTSKVRDSMGTNSVVNQCSGWYEGGALSPLAFGVGRLAYAGAAKAIPFLVRGGATEMETALAGSAMRESIKRIGNFGMKPLRSYTQEQIIAKYGGDPAKIMSAATRTSPAFNTAGGAAIGGVVGALAGRPSYCK